MEGIERLQFSHRRLQDLYTHLYGTQCGIISHELIREQDLSPTSLLKFAPIAENFQSFADDYKKELTNFIHLLNTVQQTVKQINIINDGRNNNNNNMVAVAVAVNGNAMSETKETEKETGKETEKKKERNAHETVLFDDFDITDSKEIHTNFEMTETEKKTEEIITYDSILKPKNCKQTYAYDCTYAFDGAEIYTSTMLRFSGINGLKESNEKDKDLVRQIMISQMKFTNEQIENIQIRNGRAWCIVYIRCSMKFIKDRIKKQQSKNKKIYKENREIRMKQNNTNSNSNAHKIKPIYRINEYIRRTNYNQIESEQQNANRKLYILNFDVLNKNCHKALTNLFLKFGDLECDIQIGINSRNDPYAKVLYKDINDAKILWEYQNQALCLSQSSTAINVDKIKPITFGKRILTIQYAKY